VQEFKAQFQFGSMFDIATAGIFLDRDSTDAVFEAVWDFRHDFFDWLVRDSPKKSEASRRFAGLKDARSGLLGLMQAKADSGLSDFLHRYDRIMDLLRSSDGFPKSREALAARQGPPLLSDSMARIKPFFSNRDMARGLLDALAYGAPGRSYDIPGPISGSLDVVVSEVNVPNLNRVIGWDPAEGPATLVAVSVSREPSADGMGTELRVHGVVHLHPGATETQIEDALHFPPDKEDEPCE
jgi:hypothetical protein